MKNNLTFSLRHKTILSTLFFLFFTIVFINSISADIISINSGGDNQICINSGGDVESCFFGGGAVSCIPQNCSTLGYSCGTISDGCGVLLNCGVCSGNYTCNSGVCTAPGGGSSSSSSGGGGTPTGPIITIAPRTINLTLSFNNVSHMSQRSTQQIYISNNGNAEETFVITQSGLTEIAMLSTTSVTVGPGEVKNISVDFIAPFREGDISGKIFIGTYDVNISAHITSNPLWFDSNIVVLNKNYQVSRGTDLKTRVELVPMGDKQKMDVTLNYIIKDYNGKVYLTRQETVLVSRRMNFDRNFGTGLLPLGNYVISLDLVYPGGIAPSSAHFEVTKPSANTVFGVILFFFSIGILSISMLIILLIIKRRRRQKFMATNGEVVESK
jgi:hypothetical protein